MQCHSQPVKLKKTSQVRRNYLLFLLMTLQAPTSYAINPLACSEISDPSQSIEELDLIDLMEIPVFLSASQQAECTKSAASVVSTISGEDLLNMGARDLMDALELVPGMNFGMGVSNTVGLGIRGLGADEGKLSVLIDGISLTDYRFGTTVYGSHFPVEQIDRIEIIRGPGSILHGNFAELGIINIITKKGEQLDGVTASGSYGHFSRGEARKNAVLTAGKAWNNFEVSFYGKYNYAHRSDRIYTDALGDSFDMADNNQLESLLGTFKVRYKNLNFQFLADEYNVNSRDSFSDQITPPEWYSRNSFSTYATKLSYQHDFNENFKLDTGFDFSRQTPWERSRQYINGQDNVLKEKVSVDHYKFDLKATYSHDKGHYLVIGNSYQFENYQHDVSAYTDDLPLFGNYTLYTEAVYKTPWVNILGGLRFDWYSEYNTNWSPRIALTKQLGKFHYKALYSQAFHAPTGGNYQLIDEYNQNNTLGNHVEQIVPEKTYAYELELGYDFMSNLSVSANMFYTQINNYFLYTFDENLDDFYINLDHIATWGAETSLNYNHRHLGRFKFNYSFYHSADNPSSANQAHDSNGHILHSEINLGFPAHKFSINHHLQITDSFSFNHTIIFSSDRYAYSGPNLIHYKPTAVYNTYFRYKDAVLEGLEIGLGIYDLFNAQFKYAQYYNGAHPALPGNTREFNLKLTYSF